ncbi:MAG: transcription termination/antitermination protein NusA [Synergistaceae bacterium]|nr:transcription termination/antitermination protein NusA [Synergistaceae bacterium]MBR1658019.1 transcription termination/antitermination protein NusA [Synergistaceae bacterium]
MRLGREFIEALDMLAEERGLDVKVIISTLEAALSSAYNRKYHPGGTSSVMGEKLSEVKVDHDTGEITVNELRRVVDYVKDPEHEITIDDALDIDKDAEVGKIIRIERSPADFGRIAAQTARQVITQRLRDEERKIVYSAFADRVGDMVNGMVYKVDGDQVVIHLNDKTDAILPKRERILGEKYFTGAVMKFYVLDVKNNFRGPRITVSRTHPGLLKRLMELEIPEIQQGIIEIKGVVRDGGMRAKVSLVTLDPDVDPVGACVGNGGVRIKAVSSALRNEKIDVILYSSDPLTYIKNALSPAQVARIEPVLDHEREAIAYVYPDQLSLAIGKAGQNVRLAAKLTGWKVNISTIEPDRMPTLKDIFHDVFDEDEEQ